MGGKGDRDHRVGERMGWRGEKSWEIGGEEEERSRPLDAGGRGREGGMGEGKGRGHGEGRGGEGDGRMGTSLDI